MINLCSFVIFFVRPTSSCHLTVDWELVMSLTVTWMLLCAVVWMWPIAVRLAGKKRSYRPVRV